MTRDGIVRVLVIAAALTACGGDDEENTQPAAPVGTIDSGTGPSARSDPALSDAGMPGGDAAAGSAPLDGERLVVSDPTEKRLFVYALPSFALLADIRDVAVADHPGFLPLPDGRLLFVDAEGAARPLAIALLSAVGACASDGNVLGEDPASVAPDDGIAAADAASPLDAALMQDATAAPADASHSGVDAAPSTPVDATSGALSATCAPRVSEEVVEHACLHATGGPFMDVPGAVTAEQAPDVSRAHTHYMLQRPNGLGSPRLFARYRATLSGPHALFLGDGTLSRAVDAAGSPLALGAHAAAACEALPGVSVLELARGETYTLTFDARGADVRLVVEALASWGPDAFTETCAEAPNVDASTEAPAKDPATCRRNGSCTSDAECCSFCHDGDHCH